jgi:hypothetical protein
MENSNKFSLSIAIVIASIILGIFFYVARQKDNSVKVVGYAIESFESDIIRWSFNISETTSQFDLKTAYKRLNDKINSFKICLEDIMGLLLVFIIFFYLLKENFKCAITNSISIIVTLSGI